jgi:DNA polymerase V
LEQKQYLCIDQKSFYATVECVERGLDPMTADLVVADAERSENTICLAVSTHLKKRGIQNRCRIKDIPPHIKCIVAPPRMQLYIDCAASIYGVFLKYLAPEDIYVYSIDEAFLDVTPYLKMYGMTAKELAKTIIQNIKDTVGTISTCGIGTNLYLAKIALDLTAKHSEDFIGFLDEKKLSRETMGSSTYHRFLADIHRYSHTPT